MTGSMGQRIFLFQCPSINGHFARYLRYAEILILKILNVFVRLKISRAVSRTKYPIMDGHYLVTYQKACHIKKNAQKMANSNDIKDWP
jgi:hypothetical protein